MCGIVGILNRAPERQVDPDTLIAMRDRLTHRGPDDAGHKIDGNVGIAMRRLSVIDVSGGHQPIHNEDGHCAIVYNGEVYNYPELQRDLLARGHRFATDTDTETILHLYEDDPDNFLQHLNGMFGLAVYDGRNRSVTIARDRLGIKPLYYAETREGLIFGSEIKSLLVHPALDRDLDPQAIDLFLRHKYIPAPWTAYRQIRKLPAGHALTWRDGDYEISQYWRPSYQEKRTEPFDVLAEELRDRLRSAVRSQMVSDVPLGAFLSGGIDSSAIVSLMAEASDRPIQTFSIGFDEASYNELDHAEAVAASIGADHHSQIVRPDVADLFDTVMDQFDEPFGDASAIPTFLVSQFARQNVTVALSGTGADELFAGYERYWAVGLGNAYRCVPGAIRSMTEQVLNALPSGHRKRSLIHRARSFVSSCGASPIDQHAGIVSAFRSEEMRSLYTPDFAEDLNQTDPLGTLYADSDGVAELDRLLDVDTATLLAEDYLVKDDRMSMAHSLELRVPFLDHTLVEFAASIPPEMKLKGFSTKRILKKALQDLLPSSILNRPKHGFEMPVAAWLAGPLRGHVEDRLYNSGSGVLDMLDGTTIRGLIDRHTSGQENNARQIWSLLSLDRWLTASRSPISSASPV
jgi:asparagine synthase (glutamine-hydrolysing)